MDIPSCLKQNSIKVSFRDWLEDKIVQIFLKSLELVMLEDMKVRELLLTFSRL